MRGCDQIKEQAIVSILMSHPRLNDLDIGGNNRSYDLALLLDMTERQVFKSVRNIDATLSVTVCSAGMRRLPAVFPQLQKLHLQDNTSNVSDADFDFLCKNGPCLSDLSFRAFKFFTIAALLSIARLSVSALLVLSSHLPRVESVSLRESNATEEVVHSFVANCPLLQWLDVKYSAAVRKIVAKELYEQYPTRKFKIYV
eukprot:gene12125-14051_t